MMILDTINLKFEKFMFISIILEALFSLPKNSKNFKILIPITSNFTAYAWSIKYR
jgi:hypothetical protein